MHVSGSVMDFDYKFNTSLDIGGYNCYTCCNTVVKSLVLLWDWSVILILVKSFFCTQVCPILEYGTADNSRKIERVQRRFLRFSSYLLNITYDPHDYVPVSNELNLIKFGKRRRSLSLKGILENKIDFSALLTLVSFKVSLKIMRSTVSFHILHFNTTRWTIRVSITHKWGGVLILINV
jgi:hypothetical protein